MKYLVKRGFEFSVFGAEGGGEIGGKGGYSYGTLILNKRVTFFVFVGCRGSDEITGGFNGGGHGGKGDPIKKYYSGGGGGDSSDIRVDPEDLDSRIIVAGGGGGSCGFSWSGGGDGGGLTGGTSKQRPGYDLPLLIGANQTWGYKKLYGQESIDSTHTGSCTGEGDGGGGGGWYGGIANQKTGSPNNNGGSGGSSYISGHNGCQESKTEFVFINTKMFQGINTGDGYIIISSFVNITCQSIAINSIVHAILVFVLN